MTKQILFFLFLLIAHTHLLADDQERAKDALDKAHQLIQKKL